MKKLFLTIVIFIPILTMGQNHFLGLKGGSSWGNINSKNFLPDAETITGFVGGFTYDYRVNSTWYAGADFLYAQKGFALNVTFTDSLGNPLSTSPESTEFRYDYFSVPLKAGIHVGNKISGFMGAGLVPSYLVRPAFINPDFDVEKNILNRVTKFDFAFLIEAGANVNLNQRLKVFTSMTYQDSFTTLTNDNYFSNSSIKHHALTWALGVKVAFKQED